VWMRRYAQRRPGAPAPRRAGRPGYVDRQVRALRQLERRPPR
jgi:hypothetical protein